MFKVSWDRETGGVRLSSLIGKDTVNISPRPVFYEELNLLGLDTLGWEYPECDEPLLWACNKEYYYSEVNPKVWTKNFGVSLCAKNTIMKHCSNI